ncbi:MAG: hypothetical protein ABIK65_01980 [Candidatus Eisenbacteria bacterium]
MRFVRCLSLTLFLLPLACGGREEVPPPETRPFPVFRVSTGQGEGKREIVAFLSPVEIDAAGGLSGRAAVGALRGSGTELTPENFQANQLFVEFFHEIVRTKVPMMSIYIDEAERVGDGWLHVRDLRAAGADAELEKIDVIGSFQVAGGRILPDSYVPNGSYRVLGPHGFPLLPAELQGAVLRAMRKLTVGE